MRYTDMTKQSGFGVDNPYDSMTDAQAMDFKLTNARELTPLQREQIEARLSGVAPEGPRYLQFKKFNDEYRGWELPKLEQHYKDSKDTMTDAQKEWFLKRIHGIKAQQAMMDRHAVVRTPAFIEQHGGYNPIEERKQLDAAKDTALAEAAKTDLSWFDANKDWLTGAAVGSLAGATTYGLTELIPMLRRRRFIRALIGMGVGTAAGIGASKLV